MGKKRGNVQFSVRFTPAELEEIEAARAEVERTTNVQIARTSMVSALVREALAARRTTTADGYIYDTDHGRVHAEATPLGVSFSFEEIPGIRRASVLGRVVVDLGHAPEARSAEVAEPYNVTLGLTPASLPALRAVVARLGAPQKS